MPERGWKVGPQGLFWEELEVPPLPPGWARLKLVLGGLCGTDLQLLAGYAGFSGVLGHEFVAEVVEAPESSWLGRRVVGDINVGCGSCPDCLQGDSRFCPGRRVLGLRGLDGVFADSFMLPLRQLHPVDDLEPELACWTEPLAAALEVETHLATGSQVLVLGDGRLASLIALVLQRRHRCTVLGRHPWKLQRLRHLGLEAVEELGPEEWPVVVEATGSSSGLEVALARCATRGLVVLKSTVAQAAAVNWSPVVIKALRVVGSRCGLFAPALQSLRKGEVDPRPLVDARIPLSKLPEGLKGMAEGRLVKVLVEPD